MPKLPKTQIIRKGRHFTRVRDRFWSPQRTHSQESFLIEITGPGVKYDHKGGDQGDWNKLPVGKYFNLYKPHGQTIMLGWRWNPGKDVIEVCHYYHNPTNLDDYKPVNPGAKTPGYIRKDDTILEVPVIRDIGKILLQFDIDVRSPEGDSVTTTIVSPETGVSISDKVYFKQIGAIHNWSNAYFGGNRKTEDWIAVRISKHTYPITSPGMAKIAEVGNKVKYDGNIFRIRSIYVFTHGEYEGETWLDLEDDSGTIGVLEREVTLL